ncbi:molybdate ABC transporter permease subunit [bacterium]|nr:molybdate ABC transporter permease subunit [bacterium]
MGEFALTLKLAVLTTGILLIVGTPIAYALAFARGRWKPLLEATVLLPLVLPPTVLGFYLLVGMAKLGPWWEAIFRQRLAFSFTGLLLASVCFSLPFAVQPLQAAFRGVDARLIEASHTLGASRWRTFWRVVLPASRAGVASAALLSFAHTMGEFGVVLMVGGNIPGQTRTVSIALYDMVEAMEYAQASRLALLLVVFSYLVLFLLSRLNRKGAATWTPS